jgi:hypothetical protein
MFDGKLPRPGNTAFTRMPALAAERCARYLPQGCPDFDARAALCCLRRCLPRRDEVLQAVERQCAI